MTEPQPGDPLLDAVEERVLGALIEKATTTPEYYPLTLNALVNACNQKSNRQPVVAFDDKQVARALESMRDKGLIRSVTGADQRVPKYRHVADEKLEMSAAQLAVLSELMIRGPQTVGELRGRANRMHPFEELSQVQTVLDELAGRQMPAVVKLARQPGRKESRWAHLLAGAPDGIGDEDAAVPLEPAMQDVRAENDRLAAVEQSVAQLQAEITQLREELATFRRQFD